MKTLEMILKQDDVKFGFLADIHICLHKYKTNYLDRIIDMLNEYILLCKKQEIDVVVILGDLFEEKFSVAQEALLKVNKVLAELANYCPIIILPGNHDIAYFNDPTKSLTNHYLYFNNIHVYSKLTTLSFKNFDVCILPYVDNPIEALTPIQTKRKTYLFSHFGVRGFIMSGNIKDENEDSINQYTLKKFDKVFLGHYHGYQTNNHITYVSAPQQQIFGDQYTQHGFVSFNTQDDTKTFIPNQITLNYNTVELTKENIDEIKKLENYCLEVIIKDKFPRDDLLLLHQFLKRKNDLVHFDFKELHTHKKVAVLENWENVSYKDTNQILNEYVDTISANDEWILSNKQEIKQIILEFL